MSYIIVMLVAALTFFGSIGGAYFFGHRSGAASVQAKWDIDKAERIQRTTEIVLQQTAIRDRLSEDLRKAQDNVKYRTITLVKEVPGALGPVAGVVLPSAAVELFNRAVGGDQAPARPAEGAVSTPTATVADLEEIAIENTGRHLSCIKQVVGWQTWWQQVAATYDKGEL